jgi:hypothetical protein
MSDNGKWKKSRRVPHGLSPSSTGSEGLRVLQLNVLPQRSLRAVFLQALVDLADIIFMNLISDTPQLLLPGCLGGSGGVREGVETSLQVGDFY